MSLTLELLERLVGFETVSNTSNLELIAFLESFLRARGFELARLADPTGKKSGLYAELGPAGDGILLSAHTDVVPVKGQHWSEAPFTLTQRGERIYGRGTTDMKGYVAAMLYAADRASVAPLREPLKLVFSYDEEIGCVGIQQMAERLAGKVGTPRICIVGEPTEMQVAIGHKGKAAFHATCVGQAGHSALAPKFVNALHLAADFVTGLRDVQEWLRSNGATDLAYAVPYSTVHVGRLAGGDALNIVPDRAELSFEYRHLAMDSGERILNRILATAAEVAKPYQAICPQAAIEVQENNSYPGLEVSPEAPVIRLAQALAQSDTTTKVAFGTEAGVFAGLGIPTVVCGPGSMEGQGHKPDEFLELSQLSACEDMMARIVTDLCRGGVARL